MQVLQAGRSMLLCGRQEGDWHLWFVLTDPDPITGHVVIVMVVTERGHTDKTVSLDANDHTFIRHASNVDFGTAKYMTVNAFSVALRDGRAKLQPDMSPGLLRRVQQGLQASSRTIHEIKSHCLARLRPKK